ncbi:hypothetical protein BBJ29_008968 [Phytophthora kernoviae]|uniref:Uncharacterized protein n=1 Tax=Phytophthora kernoviae TaxID=325452 RepID=A0A3F2RNU5_9STRA|nr:hypothetical protein BBP00_00005463 [Phytophthora kernoviae]RLN68489.1 hypothetical protein BBJ29_008968 [Phytophthora kernoviae]
MLVDLSPREAFVLAPLSVFLAALLTAWNANLNGFVWDDRSAVLNNLDTQSSSLYEIFTHDFWGTDIRSAHSHKSYRPLTILSFRLNFMMTGGHSSWLYHATNAVVHAGCALLVYCVACALFKQHQNREGDQPAGPKASEKENPQDDSPRDPTLEDAGQTAIVRVWINGEHRQMEWNILANNIVVQESRLTRILSHVRNAEWASEEMLFKAAVEVVPTNVKVLSNQAKTLLNPDPEQALEYLHISLGMVPKHIESQLNAGLAYVTLATNNDGNEEQFLNGVRHLYKAAMLAPKLYPAPGFLGSELFKHWLLGKKDEDKISREEFLASDTIVSATRFLDRAIDRSSVFPTHFYHRASIAYESGDYDEAIKLFRMTELANGVIRDRQVDPELLIEPPAIYNMLGVCYRKQKRN